MNHTVYRNKTLQIKLFLYLSILITVLYPLGFIVALTDVIETSKFRNDIDNLVRHDPDYKKTIELNKAICVILNLIIGIVLCASSIWAVMQLRWFFGGRFKHEVR